jgi:hypothetical protein
MAKLPPGVHVTFAVDQARPAAGGLAFFGFAKEPAGGRIRMPEIEPDENELAALAAVTPLLRQLVDACPPGCGFTLAGGRDTDGETTGAAALKSGQRTFRARLAADGQLLVVERSWG